MQFQAKQELFDFVEEVKNKNHEHLGSARIAVCLNESKAFEKNKFNFGKVTKFSQSAKIWHPANKKFDFLLNFSMQAFEEVLSKAQQEANIDLLLSCCKTEYLPEVVIENNKKKPVLDELGRVVFTKEFKLDKDGNPVYKVSPMDICVYHENVSRYGCWCEDLIEFKKVIQENK